MPNELLESSPVILVLGNELAVLEAQVVVFFASAADISLELADVICQGLA
jgi:hypothetical protein